MNTAIHYYLPGMGTLSRSTNQALQVTAVALSAVPVIGPALAGVTQLIAGLLNTGCGPTCIETSQWANQAATLLGQNISAYFAVPAPRPQAAQQQAMQNFQSVWTQLVQLCSQPGLGTAGQNCIADRQQGACHYTAAAPQYPGEPAAGSCWNWWNAYYTPIANDPDVAPATIASTVSGAVSSAVSSVTTGTPMSTTDMLVIGGVVLGAVLLFSLL